MSPHVKQPSRSPHRRGQHHVSRSLRVNAQLEPERDELKFLPIADRCGAGHDKETQFRRSQSAQIWPALGVVVVMYGLAVVVDVVVSSSPGPSSGEVDGGGPPTPGLSWLVCTLGTA